MSYLFFPHSEVSKGARAKAERAKDICRDSVLFEEALYRLVADRYSLTLAMSPTEDLLFCSISTRNFSEDDGLLGFTNFSASSLRDLYRPRLVPRKLVLDQTTGEYDVDNCWFDARDRRLKIRYGESPIAGAAALPELVLSHSLQAPGTAELNHTMIMDGSRPQQCMELKLTSLPDSSEGIIQETLFVRLDQLKRVVDRRVAKKELEQLPESACH